MRDEESHLDINVSADEKNIVVEISDNGCGIASENLPRIFDPFFTTKKDVGTGLGLWVSRELMSRNNGAISVTSSTDPESHGTLFQLVFPAASSAPPPSPQPAEEPLRAESTSRG
jgi:signal transduction histidine kinase